MHCNTEKEIFEIQSETIGLKLATTDDIEYIKKTERDDENRKFITTWTTQQHADAINSNDKTEFIIYNAQNHSPIGFTLILNINTPHKNILIKRLVITEKNKGHGRQTLELLKKWAFKEMNAHRLWLEVKDFNLKAKHLYESVGFVEEGKMREAVKEEDGSYSSLFILSVLENEYLSSQIQG